MPKSFVYIQRLKLYWCSSYFLAILNSWYLERKRLQGGGEVYSSWESYFSLSSGIFIFFSWWKISIHKYIVLVLSCFSHVWFYGDPMDHSPAGYSVQRILQAKILQWVDVSFSRESSWPRDQTHVSCIYIVYIYIYIYKYNIFIKYGGGLVAKSCLTRTTPLTVASQAPLCMGFSPAPFSSPRDLPIPGIEPWSPALQEDYFTNLATREALY